MAADAIFILYRITGLHGQQASETEMQIAIVNSPDFILKQELFMTCGNKKNHSRGGT